MKILREELKNGTLAKCYLFYGEEVYLKQSYEAKMKEAFTDDISSDMNISIFDGNVDVNAIIDAVETLPFFAEKRLVIVKDSGLFAKGKKNDSDKMASFIADIPETTCMVFVEGKVEKINVLYKALLKVGRGIEFKTPEEKDLVTWAIKELKSLGIEMDKAVATYFFRSIGLSMENAKSELDKIGAFMPKGKAVTTEDVDNICTKSLEAKVFDLIDAIGGRKTETAVEIYKNLLLAKEAPISILGMISRQFRLMVQCKASLESGEAQGNIATKIGENPYVVKKCIAQGKNFTMETLKAAMEDSLMVNSSIKNGEIGDKMAVELLIIKYTN